MEANVKAIELLKNELEEVKKEMLLAVIFFDGEDRSKIELLKNKKKGIEKDLDKLEKEIQNY